MSVTSDHNYSTEQILAISYEYLEQERLPANITKNPLLAVWAVFDK
jgi:hypothetical protein